MTEKLKIYKLQLKGASKYFESRDKLIQFVNAYIEHDKSMSEIEVDMCLGSLHDQLYELDGEEK